MMTTEEIITRVIYQITTKIVLKTTGKINTRIICQILEEVSTLKWNTKVQLFCYIA